MRALAVRRSFFEPEPQRYFSPNGHSGWSSGTSSRASGMWVKREWRSCFDSIRLVTHHWQKHSSAQVRRGLVLGERTGLLGCLQHPFHH
jgi:hypothetical protein